ncbi:MAG: nucleoside hydrolase [Actinomycetota bacterium]
MTATRGRDVFFDHDGGLDDYLSLLLLLSYEDVDLLGISITPADTVIEGALPATRKILDLAGRSNVAVAGGTLEGPNPFPFSWRLDCLKVNDLPVLNQRPEMAAPVSSLPGQEFLAGTLMGAPEPVTLLVTGPLTNLAWALDKIPGVEEKVKELVFMGGALEVEGNVQEPGRDGSAEWNVYWDPPAAKRVFDSRIPITMFPLDVTNQVPVTEEFRRAFGRQYEHPFSAAAGAIWAMTAGWDLATGLPYFCWDTLTTSYLSVPDLCGFREVGCEVLVEGSSQGRTVATSGGRLVRAAAEVDAGRFYAHCLETLKR